MTNLIVRTAPAIAAIVLLCATVGHGAKAAATAAPNARLVPATPATEIEASAILEPLAAPSAKSSAVPSFGNSASIEAGTSDTKASLTFSGYIPQTAWGDYLHYEIGGDAPLLSKGSTDEVDIGTVSGLTAGSSAHASVSAMWWPHLKESDLNVLRATCEKQIPMLIPGFKIGEVFWVANIDGDCSRALFQKPMLQKIVDGLNATLGQCRDLALKTERNERQKAEAKELAKTDKAKAGALEPKPPTATEEVTDKQRQAQCAQLMTHDDLVTTSAGQKVFRPDAKVILAKVVDDPTTLKGILQALAAVDRDTSNVTLFTLGTKVNRQKDAYFNTSDLTTLIKGHTTGYGANLGISQIRYNTLYAAGFSYEKTYKSNDAVQVCSPVAGSTSSKCPSGSIGAPKQMFSKIVFTEARILIKTGVFAVAPRLEYDFLDSKFAAKLPLYFAPDKSKALTGGLALGYVTHGDGFGASVFVNKAFSFF